MGRVKHRRVHAPSNGPKPLNPADSRLTVTSYEDVADSEDEFALERDQMLLQETPQEKLKRKWKEEEYGLSDEEILAYSTESSSDDEIEAPEPVKKKRKKGGSSESEEDSRDSEDEELSRWGTSRRDYYNTDVIETEQDALDEEKEALRLQRKKLEGLDEADYGLDKEDWMQQSSDSSDESDEGGLNTGRKVRTSRLPPVRITADMSTEEKLRLLRSRYPEFEPLAADFVRLQPILHDLKSSADAATAVVCKICEHNKQLKDPQKLTNHPLIAVIKYQALMAYLGTLCMYFAIFSSPVEAEEPSEEVTQAMDPDKLRNHSVMDSLVETRAVWLETEKLDIPTSDELAQSLEKLAAVLPTKAPKRPKKSKKPKAPRVDADGQPIDSERKVSRQLKRQQKANSVVLLAKSAKEAELAARLAQVDAEMAALSHRTSSSKPVTFRSKADKEAAAAEDSDYGEETHLDANDAMDKAQNRKSLRFYTSQIAQKQGRRERAGRGAGGDDDVPYKERMIERRDRLNREAEARGREKADELGADADDAANAGKVSDVKTGTQDPDEEYYQQIATASSRKAANKFAAAIERQNAMNPTSNAPYATEIVGPDGKRKVTYAIEKNKGLAPRRKKEVRNPRVKKRLKFEEKKKKLGSVRQVWRGGEQKGGYGGEMTGIKRDLVRSVKL